MLGAGTIVTYLAAALVKRVADPDVKAALDALVRTVSAKMGPGVLVDLMRKPEDPVVHDRAELAVQRAAECDRGFARDLFVIKQELDQLRAPRLYAVVAIATGGRRQGAAE